MFRCLEIGSRKPENLASRLTAQHAFEALAVVDMVASQDLSFSQISDGAHTAVGGNASPVDGYTFLYRYRYIDIDIDIDI